MTEAHSEFKVCKFGGSSLATAEQVAKVCRIVMADPGRRIVVVSAPGKRRAGDDKVTDLLIRCAEARLAGQAFDAPLAAVTERFTAIADALALPEAVSADIAEHLRQVVEADTAHAGRYLDAVKAAGEDNCARLVAAALTALGCAARYQHPGEAGLLLSDDYGNARLLHESYANLAHLRARDEVVVFPGFFGWSRESEVVTFPRGGSDITGSILAAAVRADLYENFTDVDSVCVIDPDLAPDVEPIRELTYREMRELSYAGFGVLHDEAIIPAVFGGIPICIKNTNAPELPGTRIVAEREVEQGHVAGIAGSDGFCTVFVSKYLMNREIGFGRRFLQLFEEEGIPFEHMPSGVDNISIILPEAQFSPDVEARICERIRGELGADGVCVEHGLALVMLVGEGMRFSRGLAARAATALAQAGVNIEMINQGSSEISLMFGVKAEDGHKAMRALYDAFFPGSPSALGASA